MYFSAVRNAVVGLIVRSLKLLCTPHFARFLCLFAIAISATTEGFRDRAFASDSKIEASIFADIDKLAKSRGLLTYLNRFEFVCFGINNSVVVEELKGEARRLGRDFSLSQQSCGIENSCCVVASHASGIVGLVVNDKVRCVEIRSFDYWTEKNQPLCSAPANLVVRPVTEAPPILPGRPRFRPSRPSYQVLERKQ